MSKFFVGQRVRIVGAGSSKFLIGEETRINEISVRAYCAEAGEQYIGHRTEAVNASGRLFVARESWLEPILPEGSAPSEYTFQQLMDNLQEVMA